MQLKPLDVCMGRQFPFYDPEVPRLEAFLDPDFIKYQPHRFSLAAPKENCQRFNDNLRGWSNLIAAAQLVTFWMKNLTAPGAVPTDLSVAWEYGRAEEFSTKHPPTLHPDLLYGMMRFWLAHQLFRTPIVGFVSIDVEHVECLRFAIANLGGALAGLALPLIAEKQFRYHLHWSKPFKDLGESAPATWGRHTMALLGYSPAGFFGPAWGRMQRMTNTWASTYIEEVLVPITEASLAHIEGSPPVADVPRLRAALAEQRLHFTAPNAVRREPSQALPTALDNPPAAADTGA